MRHILLIVLIAITFFANVSFSAAEDLAQTLNWLDRSMAISDPEKSDLWFNALSLGLEGQGWKDLDHPYDRLPSKAKQSVTKSVWGLSHQSAGLAIRFVSDSKSISARWSLRKDSLGMHHMPPMGVSGLDLYSKDKNRWRYVASASPKQKDENVATLVIDAPPGIHDYLLMLPLYNGTEKLEIGIAANARLAPAPLRPESMRLPIVFYGTSITQGGTASRTGMAYPAILGRRFDRETINLGFSGSGRMEIEMAELLAEIDAAVYVLDCLPNMNAELIHERFTPFIQRLRKLKPDTSIILVQNIVYQGGWFSKSKARHIAKNEAFEKEVAKFKSLGLRKNMRIYGGDLLGKDGLATTDGTHPNDLGMVRIANALEKSIRKSLKK